MKSALHSIMAASVFAAFSAPVEIGTGAEIWVQLLPAGTFSARDGRGPFACGGKADMEKIVAASLKFLGATDLVIDYDHQAVFGAVPGTGGTAKAAGWVKKLEVRDDGIFGLVEWTDVAAAAIKSKEYRYLSPVFKAETPTAGRVQVLKLAALTNTPALDLMAVAANATFTHEELPMNKIALLLGLIATATEGEVIASLNSVLAASTAIAKLTGAKDGATPDELVTAVNAFCVQFKDLAKAAGAKDDAGAADVVAAVKTGLVASKPDPAKFVPVDQLVALSAEINALKDGTATKAAEDAVNAAIEAGKITPALKDWGLALHKKDAAAFNTYVGAAPKLTATQMPGAKKAAGEPDISDSDRVVMSTLGLSEEAFKAARKNEAA